MSKLKKEWFADAYTRAIFTIAYSLVPVLFLLGGFIFYLGVTGQGSSYFTIVEGVAVLLIALYAWLAPERYLSSKTLIYVLAGWTTVGILSVLLYVSSDELGTFFLVVPFLSYSYAAWIFSKLHVRHGESYG